MQGSYYTVPFEMGQVVVHNDDLGGVRAIYFDLEGRYEARASSQALADDLERYFRGEKVRFTQQLDLRGETDFRRKVYRSVHGIAYGRTLSYGEVAEKVGCPGGGRAVGQVMAGNRFPLVVPCHRVVSADGTIGGFSSGIELKRFLLRLEGSDI